MLDIFGEETKGPRCTEAMFVIDLQQPHLAWNQCVVRVFTSSFIHFHDLPTSDQLYNDLVKGFFVRMRSLWWDHLISLKNSNQVAQWRQRDRQKAAVGSSPYKVLVWFHLQLFEWHLRTCMSVSGLNKHIQIIKQFGVAGMSSDKSDYEEAKVNPAITLDKPIYCILLPKFWKSSSGKLQSFFHFIDQVHVLKHRSGGPSRGDLPHKREHVKTSLWYSQQDITINNLPVNAYDAGWLSKCSLIWPTLTYDFSHDFMVFK